MHRAAAHDSLIDILWQGKWILIVITAMFALASIWIALTLPNQYRAEAVLAPAESSNTSGLAGLASQFGGLASLAGISVGAGQNNQVGEALALLTSRAFIQDFIDKRGLLPQLLAVDFWDEDTGELVLNTAVYDKNTDTWTRTPPKGKAVEPTPWEGYSAFIQLLDVNEMGKDGTLKVAIESLSPSLSKQWLEWLIEDLNASIADREMEEARKSITYLRAQIESTPIKELHTIFYSLIEEQTKKIMLAEVREDYVFKVLAAPVFPEDRSAPNRALICLGLTLFGGLFAVLILVIRHILRHAPQAGA